MLDIAFANFQNKISELNTHIEYQKDVVRLIKKLAGATDEATLELRHHIIASLQNEKVFLYTSNVIFLYGAFEHFIEEICKEYVSYLSIVIKDFDKLEPKIVDDYFSKWSLLPSKLSYSKFSHLNLNFLIANINEVINDNKNKILSECFIQNGGNYRHRVVSEVFQSLGRSEIDSKIQKYPKLQSVLSNLGLDNTSLDSQFKTIDDIVERRNTIAHGAEIVDILDEDSVSDAIAFFEAYAEALTLFLKDYIYSNIWKSISTPEIKPTNVYQSNIAVFTVTNITIKEGMTLLVKNTNDHYPVYYEVLVEEIRYEDENGDGIKVETYEVFADPKVISLKLNKNSNINMKYKIYNTTI